MVVGRPAPQLQKEPKSESPLQLLPPFGIHRIEPHATEHDEGTRLSIKDDSSGLVAAQAPKTATPTRLSVDDRRKRALAKRQQQQAFTTTAVGDMMDAARRQSLLSPVASFAMDSASSQEGRRLGSQSRTLSFSIPDRPRDKTLFDQTSPRVPRKSPSMTPFAPLLHRDISSALESVGSASLSAPTERNPPSVLVSPTPQRSTEIGVEHGKSPRSGATPDIQSMGVPRIPDTPQIASAPPTVPPPTLQKVDSLRLQSHGSGETLSKRVARSPSSLSLLSKHSAELFRSPSLLKRPASLPRRESDPTSLIKTSSITPPEGSQAETTQLGDKAAAPQRCFELPAGVQAPPEPLVKDKDVESALRETTFQRLKDAERRIDGIQRQATQKSYDVQITRETTTQHAYTPYQIDCLVRLQSWWRGRLTRIMITAALVARNTEYGLLPEHKRYLRVPFLPNGHHYTDPPSTGLAARLLLSDCHGGLTKTGATAFAANRQPFSSFGGLPAMRNSLKFAPPSIETGPPKSDAQDQRHREGPRKASAWPRTLVRTLCDFLDTLETAPHRCSGPSCETNTPCSDRQSWHRNNALYHPTKTQLAAPCDLGARQFSCTSRHGTSTITGVYNYHSERQCYPPFAFALEKRVLRQLQRSRSQRQAIARSWLCDPRDGFSDPKFSRGREISFFPP